MFAHAAKRSLTNWFEIRRAISASGNVLNASRIFSAMCYAGTSASRPANPAATEHDVTVVNDCRLSRRYGALRFMQSHPGTIILGQRNRCGGAGMVVANLNRRFERRG